MDVEAPEVGVVGGGEGVDGGICWEGVSLVWEGEGGGGGEWG